MPRASAGNRHFVPQLDPFGRPLTAESASRLGTEQAGRVPGKLIGGAVALVLAALVALGVVLALHADREKPVATVAKPRVAPAPPKLLAPTAFSQAFYAAMSGS